jgi:alkanesulfonate monooxygenase SsuD/methylene tetrahydromethanopterin reductase-like flavin-dependent oxidoreductase (luciferase family)
VPDYGHRLQFATFPEPSASPPLGPVDLAVLSEEWGYDLVMFQDHPYRPEYLDVWTLMNWAAARTSRIHVAPNVLNMALRSPALVAKSAASIDLLSGGRFELGLGAGFLWNEIAAMGFPHRPPAVRRRRHPGPGRRRRRRARPSVLPRADIKLAGFSKN